MRHYSYRDGNKLPSPDKFHLILCPRKTTAAVLAPVKQRKALGLRTSGDGAVVMPLLYQLPALRTRIQKWSTTFLASLSRFYPSEIRFCMPFFTDMDIKISHDRSSPSRNYLCNSYKTGSCRIDKLSAATTPISSLFRSVRSTVSYQSQLSGLALRFSSSS